jgi:predicted component of type VI protein secretion system
LAAGERKSLGHGDTLSLGGFELTLSMPGQSNKTQMAMSGRTAAIAAPPTTSTAVAFLILPEGEKPLSPGTYNFGRKPENQVVISDPYVSGKHGEFEVTADGVFVSDTGSTNGTVLNDAKLTAGQKVRLQASDVIKLGSVEVRVRYRG